MRKFLDKLSKPGSNSNIDVKSTLNVAPSSPTNNNSLQRRSPTNDSPKSTPGHSYSTTSATVATSTTTTTATTTRSRFLMRGNKVDSKYSSVEETKIISLIQTSAQRLKIVIDEILNDASGLTGDNVVGFIHLMEILDSEVNETTSFDHGYGCLSILLTYRQHERFIECCNSFDLANALFNVIRLLRMYEIKQVKLQQEKHQLSDEPRTYKTMVRVMSVFSTLLESSQSIELLRPSLVKLFVFPLSLLPTSAIHFQTMTAELISLICKPGLTSQIVWFLHDQQSMHHMARQLTELTSLQDISSENMTSAKSSGLNDLSLRGLAGEQAGLWLTALKCVIDVITSSVSVSPVLMVDFERAGGYKIIVHILEHCSPERSMETMNTTIRLFFDPSLKSEEPLSFPDVGIILSDILISCLGLKRRISDDDSLEKLMVISQHLQDHNTDMHIREYLLQSFSYSLLTIYSNDPRNCNVLEEHFHYLPTLIIALPALGYSDTISAILTTLNYVCQCVETAAPLPLVAFCAASSVTLLATLSITMQTSLITRANMQFDFMISSYDAIIRSNGRYAMVLINGGWLKYMITNPFELLRNQVERQEQGQGQGQILSLEMLLIYEKLIDLMINFERKGQYVGYEIKNCGVLTVISYLINSNIVPPAFTRKLLTIHESMSLSDVSHLRYSIESILNSIAMFGINNPSKSICLIEALRSILLTSERAPSIWIDLNGIFIIMGIMKSMNGLFLVNNSNSNSNNNNDNNNITINNTSTSTTLNTHNQINTEYCFYLLGSIAKLFSAELSLTYPYTHDIDYVERRNRFHQFYMLYAYYLWNTEIFTISTYDDTSLHLIFILIQGDMDENLLQTPSAIIILLSLLPHLKSSLRIRGLKKLKTMISKHPIGSQLVAESGVITFILEHYFGSISKNEEITKDLLEFIRMVMSKYLRISDFLLYLRNVIRPCFAKPLAELSSYSQHLFPAWIGYHSTQEDTNYWNHISPLLQNTSLIRGVPFVTLGTLGPLYRLRLQYTAYISFVVSEAIEPFPSANFTLSTWIQIPNMTSDSFSGMITILSITTTPSSSNGCFLEVQLSCHNFEVLVIFRHGIHLSTLKFKPNIIPSHSSWTLLTFAYKRGKRFPIPSKSSVNIYLNGISSEAVEIDGIETELQNITSQVEFVIGKSYIDSIEASSLQVEIPQWNLGPFLFFDETLTSSQIAVVFMKGPTYTGNFQGTSLSDSAATVSTYMLKECNTTTKSVDSYFESLGFKGLENVVDPSNENKFEISTLPRPIFLFSVNHVNYITNRRAFSPMDEFINIGEVKTSIGENILFRYTTISLLNSSSAQEGEIISARIFHNTNVSNYESFSSCISSLGGPLVLFPILQYASNENQICYALQLLRMSIISNIPNIRYMKRVGYKLIAFLISLKPSIIITLKVIDELFEFCIDRSSDDSIPKNETILLIDTAALFYLIMNHRVWNPKRYSFAMRIIQLLLSLIKDPRYSKVNIMRLSNLGITSWLLHLCIFGIEQYARRIIMLDGANGSNINNSNNNNGNNNGNSLNANGINDKYDNNSNNSGNKSNNSNDNNDGWIIKCNTDEELSTYADEKDPFLSSVIYMVLRIISSDVKLRDVEIVSQAISLTLTSSNYLSVLSNKSQSSTITSFSSIDMNSSVSDKKFISVSRDYSPSKLVTKQDFILKSTIHSILPFNQLRVYLIRLVYQICENNFFGNINNQQSGLSKKPSLLSSSSSSPGPPPPSSSSSTSNNNNSNSNSTSTNTSNQLFYQQFHLEWMLNFIEMSSDIASKSHGLRLLGLFIQTEMHYYLEFCNKRAYKLLESIILSNATLFTEIQLLPLSLPLIAMAFQISLHVLPHPFQITSSDKILQLLELEECFGPSCLEAEAYRFTLPMLSLLLTLITTPRKSMDSSNSNSNVTATATATIVSTPVVISNNIVNDSILKIISYYFEKNVGFRQLFQHRYSIDMITSSLVISSNAVDDFGSHIYHSSHVSSSSKNKNNPMLSYSDGPMDLGLLMREDYISSSYTDNSNDDNNNGSNSNNTNVDNYNTSSNSINNSNTNINNVIDPIRVSSDEDVENHQISYNEKIIILNREGERLLQLLTYMIDSAYKEFSNFMILNHIFLSFPSNMDEGYTYSYQILIFNEAKRIIEFMIQKNFGNKIITAITNSFALLIPILKAKILHDKIQLEIFKVLIDLMDRLQAHKDMNQKLDDLYMPIIRDIMLTARYFGSYLLFETSTTSSNENEDIIVDMLATVRHNIVKLMPKFMDESIDSVNITKILKQISTDDKNNSTIGILDSFQLIWTPDQSFYLKKASSTEILTLCSTERLKVSNAFLTIITGTSLILLSNDVKSVLAESLRLLTLISIHRKTLIRQLLSPEAQVSGNILTGRTRQVNDITDEFDLFEDGISKLLPPASYHQVYLSYLCGLNSDSIGEDKRFYDFYEWYQINSNFIQKYLRPIDNYMKSLIPLSLSSHHAIRQIQAIRLRDRPSITSGSNLSSFSNDSAKGMDHATRQSYKICNSLRSWKMRGMASLSSGSVLWKHAYQSLQTGPVWGYDEIKEYIDITKDWNEDTILFKFATKSSSSLLSQIKDFRGCKLDLSEGPERMRKKLDQDYSFYQQKLWISLIQESNQKIAQKIQSKHELLSSSSEDQQKSEENGGIKSPPSKSRPTSSSMSIPNKSSDTSLHGFLFTPIVKSMDQRRGSVQQISSRKDIGSIWAPLWKRKGIAEDDNNSYNSNNNDHDGNDHDDSYNNNNYNRLLLDHQTTVSPDGVADMAEFVKEMAKQGIIKRIESESSSGYDNLETSVIESIRNRDRDVSMDIGNIDNNTIDSVSSKNIVFDSSKSKKRVSLNRSLESTFEESDLSPRQVEGNYTDNEDRLTLNDSTMNIQEDELSSTRPLLTRYDSGTMDIITSNIMNNGQARIASKYNTDISKSFIIEEVLKGLLGISDWNQGDMYNIDRISGLEASRGLLVITENTVYIINGIIMSESKDSEAIENKSKLLREASLRMYDKSPRQEIASPQTAERTFEWLLDSNMISGDVNDGEILKNWIVTIWKEILESDIGFSKTSFSDIYSVFKRRHHLKYTALEYTDIHGYSILFSCPTVDDANTILAKFFESSNPPILFRNINSFKNLPAFLGVNHAYKVMISQYLSSLTKLWQNGETSNFEYIIQLNSVAGRSYLDLTQYPVFPWVIADYSSNTIDLTNPIVYRDLSRPMGALGLKRSFQFKERFKSMDEFQSEGAENNPPPFHYGTHYSCAGYVLYYLLRVQPYSNYAMALQGGQFDLSDRLFLSIESSWKSASSENLQDVRELIPEFFYLPEFLMNLQEFDFGITQKGQQVNNVELPPWANNDPYEFIRINRAALESKYVSERLHDWIDLIFGYKQRGQAAESAMNVFIHVTYEGEVDIDAITDPMMQMATIAQINNFGQTPSMLFSRPHPKKIVPEVAKKSNDTMVIIDSSALTWHNHLNPPLTVIGAPKFTILNRVSYSQMLVPTSTNTHDVIVSDICYHPVLKLITTPAGSYFLPPMNKKIIKYESSSGSILIAPVLAPNTQRDQDRDTYIFDNLHQKDITCIAISKSGDLLVTGSVDTSIRLWALTTRANKDYYVEHLFTFIGHYGEITCLDINSDYSMIVSGSSDRKICVWDSRTGRLRFIISDHCNVILSVSINQLNGNIISISSSHIHISSINSQTICFEKFSDHIGEVQNITKGCIVLAPSVADWQDGVIAVTGHELGFIYLWKFSGNTQTNDGENENRLSLSESSITTYKMNRKKLIISHSPIKTHRANITCLKLMIGGPMHTGPGSRIKDFVDRTFDDNNSLELYVGDSDGYVSRYSVQRLDQLSQPDVQSILTNS